MIRRLSPAGVAAVAVLLVDRPVPAGLALEDRRGGPAPWPPEGRVRHAVLRAGALADDVLVVGRARAVELHVHGGPGVVQAVLAAAGGERDTGGAPPVPDGPRAARARASVAHGRLAALGAALRAGDRSDAVLAEAREVLARAPLADRLVRPPVVRLVGRPNAGKSTLFNALLLEDRALVSPRAGTTRDTVAARCRLAGATVQLEDTRGDAQGAREAVGADLLVHLTSGEGAWAPPRAPGSPPVLRVAGKADLGQLPAGPAVSGRTGAGLPALRARIAAALALAGGPGDDVLAPVDPAFLETVRRLLSGGELRVRRGANGPEKVR